MIGSGISHQYVFVHPGSLFVRAAVPDIRAGWVGAGTGSARLFARHRPVVFRVAGAVALQWSDRQACLDRHSQVRSGPFGRR